MLCHAHLLIRLELLLEDNSMALERLNEEGTVVSVRNLQCRIIQQSIVSEITANSYVCG